MSLQETLATQITESMKARDSFKTDTLRMLKGAVMNAGIAKADHTLSPEEEIEVVQREIKKRRQSIEMYTTGGRAELAEKEQQEIAILETYLPAQMSEEELCTIIAHAVEQTGAKTPQEMGKVMGMIMPQVKGKTDSSKVSELVKQALNG